MVRSGAGGNLREVRMTPEQSLLGAGRDRTSSHTNVNGGQQSMKTTSTLRIVDIAGDQWEEWDQIDPSRTIQGVLWIDLCATDQSVALQEQLLTLCPGLGDVMIHDLFDRDSVAKVH